MYQAYAYDILNQKESENDSYFAENRQQPLYEATERLALALSRLEQNIAHFPNQQQIDIEQQEQLAFFEHENLSLKQHSDHLSAAITQLQQQYSDLYQSINVVYDRIEHSIAKVADCIAEA